MVHKIHMGKDLPLIVNGPPGINYTIGDTTFAQKDANGVVTGVGYPRAHPRLHGLSCTGANGIVSYMERPASLPLVRPATRMSTHPRSDSPAGPPGTNHVANRGFA